MNAPADRGAQAPGRLERLRSRDHTRGNLLTSMAVLSLPLVASSVLGGAVFQLVDLAFISRLGEDAVTAIVVTNQSLRQVVFMLVLGASFGAQGLISRCIGAGDVGEAEHVAGQMVVLGLAISAVFAVVGAAFPAELLSALAVSPAVLDVGVPYVRLVFLLNFGFVSTFLFSAIFNGAGDATTPLVLSIVGTAASLLGEWMLIFGRLGAPELGIQGVVWGLFAGQVVAGALALWLLFGSGGRVRLRLRHFVPDPPVLRRIASLSWPPALQMLGGFLVNVMFIRLMGQLGEQPQAAYSIGLRISMMGPMLAFPLAGASAVLVGQNLGAGRIGRAWQSLGVGVATNVALLWTIAAGMALFREPIMGMLSSDPEVIRLGALLLLFQAGCFAAWAFFFVFFRSLQGAGDVAVPMLISLGVSLLIVLPLGYALAARPDWGPTGIFTASLVGAWLNTILTGAWVATGRWTRKAGPRSPSA